MSSRKRRSRQSEADDRRDRPVVPTRPPSAPSAGGVTDKDHGRVEGHRPRPPLALLRYLLVLFAIGAGLVGFVGRSWLFGKSLGEYATDAADCRSGRILRPSDTIFPESGGVCTDQCLTNADCNAATRCLEGSCAPRPTVRFGGSCSASWQCTDSFCLTIDPGLRATNPMPRTICSRRCDADSLPCPAGFTCDAVDQQSVCVPDEPFGDAATDACNDSRESNPAGPVLAGIGLPTMKHDVLAGGRGTW